MITAQTHRHYRVGGNPFNNDMNLTIDSRLLGNDGVGSY